MPGIHVNVKRTNSIKLSSDLYKKKKNKKKTPVLMSDVSKTMRVEAHLLSRPSEV